MFSQQPACNRHTESQIPCSTRPSASPPRTHPTQRPLSLLRNDRRPPWSLVLGHEAPRGNPSCAARQMPSHPLEAGRSCGSATCPRPARIRSPARPQCPSPRAARARRTSGTLPAASAAAIALGGRVICGKAYMAPCGALQLTPSSELSPSTSMSARRFMLERMASFSAW